MTKKDVTFDVRRVSGNIFLIPFSGFDLEDELIESFPFEKGKVEFYCGESREFLLVTAKDFETAFAVSEEFFKFCC